MRPPDWPPVGVLLVLLNILHGVASIPVNDALNASHKISPACRQALTGFQPNSLAWREANYASADFATSVGLLLSKLIVRGKGREAYAIVSGFSVSDLGSYDGCMALVGQGFHYCDVRIKQGAVLRWGLCLPQGCTPDDVRAAMLPPNAGSDMVHICDTGAPVDRSAAHILGGVIVLLLALSAAATAMDLRQGRRRDSCSPPPSSPRPSPWRRGLECFSLVRGLKELLGPRRGPFTSLDGIRALSMYVPTTFQDAAYAVLLIGRLSIYVIHGHTYLLQGLALGFSNLNYTHDTWDGTMAGTLINGSFFAVSAFLYLSGFLAVTFGAKVLSDAMMTRKRGASSSSRSFLSSVPLMYLHRWLRIVPAFAFIVAAYLILAPYVMEGPVSYFYREDVEACSAHWWWSLLMVANFLTPSMWKLCYSASWYLNVDFQLWMTTPFFVVLGVNHERAAYALAAALWLASVLYSAFAADRHDLTVNILDRRYGTYELYYYIQPWTRFPAYYTGCVSGLLWVHHGEWAMATVRSMKPRALRRRLAVAASVAAVLLVLPILGTKGIDTLRGETWSHAKRVVYIALGEPAWTIGLAILTAILILRLGGPVNVLLECRCLLVLSRLTFGAYLIHPALLYVWSSARAGMMPHFSVLDLYVTSAGFAVMSFLLAAAVFLLVEKPFGDLSRLLLASHSHGSGRGKQVKSETVVVLGGQPSASIVVTSTPRVEGEEAKDPTTACVRR